MVRRHPAPGVSAELLAHRLLDEGDEPITAGVPLGDQGLDHPADLAERLVDFSGVLAGELHDLGGVPHDVVLANLLEPEGRDAHRRFAHFAVPDEESGSEGFAVDLGPAGGIDQEAEQVLLSYGA